jgi:signal transduction histidine kinase/tetratricopeptide (TPR) repeat protein
MKIQNLVRALLLLVLFSKTNPGFAQNSTLLITDFEKLRNKTEDLLKLYPDSALIFANRLMAMATSAKSEALRAVALSTLSNIKIAKSLPDEALVLNESSYLIHKRLKDKKEIANNLSQFGTIYQNKGDYVNATKYFIQSLDIAKELKAYSIIKYNYRCLSKINFLQNKAESALEYACKSINLDKISPNPREKALGLVSIADYYSMKNNIDSAEKYYAQSYDLLQKNNIHYSMAWVLSLWAIIYAEKDLIKTGEMMLKAQTIFDTIAPESVFSANNIGNIGEVYFTIAKNDSLIAKPAGNGIPGSKAKLLSEAEQYFKRCLLYSAKSKNVYTSLYFTGNLADLQAYNGDYKNAYSSLQAKFKYNDSLFSQKNKNAIAKLESEKELQQLTAINKQKSILNRILIGSAAALLLIGILGYRNFKTKQKLHKTQIIQLEKDKQLLAIDAMLKGQEEERSRLAKDLHDGLGGMLSGVKLSFVNMKENLIMDAESVTSFEKSILQLDNTIAELRKVAHNLMPEALVKFGLKNALLDFCNSMQLSGKTKIIFEHLGIERLLSNTADLYIYRIVQELINNALKHADANQILVQLTKTNDKVLLTVEDDGKGFNTENINPAKGIGLKNMQQRVDYLKGKIDIASQAGEGTSVNIELYV